MKNTFRKAIAVVALASMLVPVSALANSTDDIIKYYETDSGGYTFGVTKSYEEESCNEGYYNEERYWVEDCSNVEKNGYATHSLLGAPDSGGYRSASKYGNEPPKLLTKINADGTLTITGYTGYSGHVDIPSEIDGKKVTAIGPDAFKELGIESVTFNEGLETISKSAFFGNKISKIDLPQSLSTIGYNAFYKNEITSLVIPDKITEIDSHTFTGNKIKTLTLNKNLKGIGIYAFSFNYLEELYIPDSIVKIEDNAFSFNNIKEVSVPSTYENEYAQPFYGNNGVTIITRNENGEDTKEQFHWW